MKSINKYGCVFIFDLFGGAIFNVKIVFVSNYYNHHQAPLSIAMNRLTSGSYCFIETEKISLERIRMGWGESNIPSFVKQAYTSREDNQKCINIINNADVVIWGSADRRYVEKRLNAGKLTFMYTERIFKTGYQVWRLPVRLIKWHQLFGKYNNLFLLCASAYTASDFAITLNFINKAYKWGYFTEKYQYNPNDLMQKKNSVLTKCVDKPDEVAILWVGRLIQCKHPEAPIEVAKYLSRKGYNFKLRIIGIGVLEDPVHKMVQENGLDNYVEFLGSMKPAEVRSHMEIADIFLFTSDFNEGWGAVLNEAMNSGCAVVASHAIGSVPFLIQDNKNGTIYRNGDIDELSRKVERLIVNPSLRRKLGLEAYRTISELWNADTAAERLITLSKDLLELKISDRYTSGPCSRSPIVFNGWYRE